MDFDILFATLFVWSCHLRVSETLKPRKSKYATFQWAPYQCGGRDPVTDYLDSLQNEISHFFLCVCVFSDNLFESNHTFIARSSAFMAADPRFASEWKTHKVLISVVSSAYKNGVEVTASRTNIVDVHDEQKGA